MFLQHTETYCHVHSQQSSSSSTRRIPGGGSEVEEAIVIVTTEQTVRAPTPGQSVAFYDMQDNVCLGGGTIVQTGPSIACSSINANVF